jgi:hypothetical protein
MDHAEREEEEREEKAEYFRQVDELRPDNKGDYEQGYDLMMQGAERLIALGANHHEAGSVVTVCRAAIAIANVILAEDELNAQCDAVIAEEEQSSGLHP